MQNYLVLLFLLAGLLVVASPSISWFIFLKRRSHSLLRSSVVGAFSGLVGTLIWPTGYLIWHCIENMNHHQMGGFIVVIILVISTFSTFMGAALSVALSTSNRSKSRSQDW